MSYSQWIVPQKYFLLLLLNIILSTFQNSYFYLLLEYKFGSVLLLTSFTYRYFTSIYLSILSTFATTGNKQKGAKSCCRMMCDGAIAKLWRPAVLCLQVSQVFSARPMCFVSPRRAVRVRRAHRRQPQAVAAGGEPLSFAGLVSHIKTKHPFPCSGDSSAIDRLLLCQMLLANAGM